MTKGRSFRLKTGLKFCIKKYFLLVAIFCYIFKKPWHKQSLIYAHEKHINRFTDILFTNFVKTEEKKNGTLLLHTIQQVLPSLLKSRFKNPFKTMLCLKIHCKALATKTCELYSISGSIRSSMLSADLGRYFCTAKRFARATTTLLLKFLPMFQPV